MTETPGMTGTPGTPTDTMTPEITPGTPLPRPTATACPMNFRDVDANNPFYNDIRYLYCAGVISGYTCGPQCLEFRWGNNTTRGQLTKIVVLAMQWPISTPTTPSFKDVPASDPFFQFVETAVSHNIISGYDCGGPGEPCPGRYFRPGNNVTRGQLSKIVVGAMGWTDEPPGGPHFADVGTTNPFYREIERAAAHGIISGYNCGGPTEPCDPQGRNYFRWGNNATRGQISKIVHLAVIQRP